MMNNYYSSRLNSNYAGIDNLMVNQRYVVFELERITEAEHQVSTLL